MESFFAFFRRIWVSGLTTQITRAILVAAVFTLVEWLLVRWMRRRLGPTLVRDAGADPAARVRRRRALIGAPALALRIVLYTVAMLMILRIFRLQTAKELLPMGLALLAVGLVAGQGVLRDMIAGYFILYDHLYSEGDEVIINQVEGTVEQVSLRHTRLRSTDGEIVTLPHHQVEIVINRSRGREQG